MKNQVPMPSAPSETPDWIRMEQALKLLDRSRTWLQDKMVLPEEVKHACNVNELLVKGADWDREGNRIIFKPDSIKRIKESQRLVGRKYDEKKLAGN